MIFIDVNNDGYLDMFLFQPGVLNNPEGIGILLNDPNEADHFGVKESIHDSDNIYAQSGAVVIDDDGDFDVVVLARSSFDASGTDRVLVYENKGDNTFESEPGFAVQGENILGDAYWFLMWIKTAIWTLMHIQQALLW